MLLALQPGDLRLSSWHHLWVLLKYSAHCPSVYKISTPGETQFLKASCKLSLSRNHALSCQCLLATSFSCPKLHDLLFLMQCVFAGAGTGLFLKRRPPWRSVRNWATSWHLLRQPLLGYLLLAAHNNREKLSRQLVILMGGKKKKPFCVDIEMFHGLSLTSSKL